MSARELKAETHSANAIIKQQHQGLQTGIRNYLINAVSPEAKQQMKKLIKEENDE